MARWRGIRRALCAYGLGACAAAAMPPFFLFPLLVVSYCGLGRMLARAGGLWRAAGIGWCWGLGFFTCGLYWMCIALLTDPEKFAWLIPFTLLGLHGALAMFSALAAMLYAWLKPRGAWRAVALASCFMLVEYARGHILTGFPWNLPGYAWAFSDSMSQSASWWGIYGLSALTLLAACAPLGGVRFLACVWACVAVVAGAGGWRLHAAAPVAFVPGVQLRLVQGDIPQSTKWEPEKMAAHFRTYVDLSAAPPRETPVTHIIWPETAVPYSLTRDAGVLETLEQLAPPQGALITGAVHAENGGYWNALAVITRQGISAHYDKHHLVPFGEYLPLRAWLPEVVTPAGMGDFDRGPGPQSLSIPGAPPASPLICYEAIFPAESVPRGARVDWLLNITNDAWFGASTGPYQHFHMSRMRAIEQGLPLVRAANTGISAVTDSYGRVLAQLGLNQRGVLDAPLPEPLGHPTIYSRLHDEYLLLLICLTILLMIYQRRDNQAKR